ncbi:MAG: two-component sensor histidine kinase [Comamonas sp.]|jgi:signal transduction histidine kinase|nr:two-component sensor histidine kinase [Comamonas sp.]
MRSLRVRLLVWLCLALCTLWGGVAAWMFAGMRHELRSVLDDRLIASAHMVAGIVHQFKPENVSPNDWGPMLNVVSRDGVACEVSMLRSEVRAAPAANVDAQDTAGQAPRPALIPASPLDRHDGKTVAPAQAEPASDDSRVVARSAGAPSFQAPLPLGFSTMTKGGRPWRTYVLEEHGVRIATADRIDVREGLVHGFAYTIILPFVLALLASMLLMWWGVTRGLKPLESLRQELSQRPPGDDSPVAQGHQVRELAPLVQTINHMLQRVHSAIERERRWSDDAAHELRTPLTAVKAHVQVAQMAVDSAGSLQMVRNDPQGPNLQPTWHPVSETPQWLMARDALRQAGEGVEHLQHTLEQLLLLARLDCQPLSESADSEIVCGSEPACAWDALEKAWELASTAIPSGHARLGWLPGQRQGDARLEDLHVVVPQPLLVSALRNLIENALHYGQEPGTETSECPVFLGMRHVEQLPQTLGQSDRPASPAGYVQLVVADQGPGLSAEDCSIAVQRFWRKKHQSHGSGLGLAIVQRIAQCSGGALQLMPLADWEGAGTVWALEGEQSTGLVVSLYLPVLACRAEMVEA